MTSTPEILDLLSRVERLEKEVAELRRLINQLLTQRYPRRDIPIQGEHDIPRRLLGDRDFPPRWR